MTGCSQPSAPPSVDAVEPTAVGTENLQPPLSQPEESVPGLPIETDDFTPESGFTALGIEDFTPLAGQADAWQEIDGVIVCSGQPKGYLYSNIPYDNFTWRAEYRFVPVVDEAKRPLSNTGFMIHIELPHKVWPRSLEVQGRWDEIASIKANGGAADLIISDDAAARESARNPVGEWNAVEIVSKNGALTATLNGELVCLSEPGELTEGLIGLQSELFEVHFRRMRIRAGD